MRDPKDNGVYPLFPTPVLQANKLYTPTKKELKFIHELKRRPNTGSNYSSINGTFLIIFITTKRTIKFSLFNI